MIAAATGHRDIKLPYEVWKELKVTLLSTIRSNNVTTAIGDY